MGLKKGGEEDATLSELGLRKEDLREEKAIEVGNIFPLGTRFSDALNLTYKNEAGESVPVVMGSYGIGPARLIGTVVECLADGKGLVWPEAIAPFAVHLVQLGDDAEVQKEAQELYRELTLAGIEALWDDRDARAGEKFADSDLIGIPLRVVVSQKSLAEGKFECIERSSVRTEHRSISELVGHLSSNRTPAND